MPLETIAVLGTVMAMFVIFGTTLAWVSHRTGSPAGGRTEDNRRNKPVRSPGSEPATTLV